VDFVVGNHGLNSRFKASPTEPVSMYINDFDKNGSVEHIVTRYDRGASLPLVLKPDLVAQIPSLKKKYLHFKDYKEKTISDIFGAEHLKNAFVLNAYAFETAIWINNKDGTFSKRILPVEAQFFPVYALLVDDFDGDTNLDILLGGNLHRAKPETGIYAGGYGLLLHGKENGTFESVSAEKSGLKIKGEIRALKGMKVNGKNLVLAAKNNDRIEVLRY
jgi:enediyne biosynthesis protein E4